MEQGVLLKDFQDSRLTARMIQVLRSQCLEVVNSRRMGFIIGTLENASIASELREEANMVRVRFATPEVFSAIAQWEASVCASLGRALNAAVLKEVCPAM
jgi:hypothetical protein